MTLSDLIDKYGEERINGLLSGTHMIVQRKKAGNVWLDFLAPLTIEDMWHCEDLNINQRGCIYRAAHSLDMSVRVRPAEKALGKGEKGIVIEMVK